MKIIRFFETFSRKTNYKLFEIIAKQLHLKEFKNTVQNKYYWFKKLKKKSYKAMSKKRLIIM